MIWLFRRSKAWFAFLASRCAFTSDCFKACAVCLTRSHCDVVPANPTSRETINKENVISAALFFVASLRMRYAVDGGLASIGSLSRNRFTSVANELADS